MSTEVHAEQPPFNLGVYTVAEAARLVSMPADWVRRALKGYEFQGRQGKRGKSKPLFRGQFDAVGGTLNLSFRDLVELVFVRDFRKAGVSWPMIRRTAEVAAKLWQEEHPFCVKRFSTDGVGIFASLEDEAGGRGHMLDVAARQHVFEVVTAPFIKQLEYSATGDLLRWFPMGKKKPVVLDPRRSFGAPIIAGHGVPTSVLFDAFKAGDSEKSIAEWYELPLSAVGAALEYERSLAA